MWFIAGIIIGTVGVGLAYYLSKNKVEVWWYETVLAIAGTGLVVLGVHDFLASFFEYETRAAWTFLAIFTLPGTVMLAVAAYLAWARFRKKERSE